MRTGRGRFTARGLFSQERLAHGVVSRLWLAGEVEQ